MLKVFLTIIVACTLSITAQGQLTATEIIDKSIKYHDPDGVLAKEQFTLKLLETRPNGTDRTTKVFINQSKQIFSIKSVRNGQLVTMQREDNLDSFTIDEQTELSPEQIKEYKLTSERLQFMVNYYRYLWMSPLILRSL